MAGESLERRQQKKVARTLIRLKHSLVADRELEVVLQALVDAETNGVVPQLETTLAELLESDG